MAKYPYLCGGVLFLLMLECNRKTEKKNSEVIDGLVKAVTGNSLSPTRSDASYYLGCKRSKIASIPFYEKSTRGEYDSFVRTKYDEALSRMDAFVGDFMKCKHDWFVKAVLDIMEQDSGDDLADADFYINPDGRPVKRDEAINQTRYHLPAFMTGIMHFVVTHRGDKNEEGSETIDRNSENPDNHGRIYNGTLGERITRKITVTTEEIKKPPRDEAAGENDAGAAGEGYEPQPHEEEVAASVYIDKQVVIGHNEVKNVDIKDSVVTLNL